MYVKCSGTQHEGAIRHEWKLGLKNFSLEHIQGTRNIASIGIHYTVMV